MMPIQKKRMREGSSLIIVILMMGILMILTVGLSGLAMREIGQTSNLVRAGQAYYAAEAGIENALLELENSFPGYETGKEKGKYTWEEGNFGGNTTSADFQYQIRNQGDRYPYFDEEKPVYVAADMAVPKTVLYKDYPKMTYNVLPLNQTVTIPLFVDCGDGSGRVYDVKDFLLEYFVDFNVDPEITGRLMNGYFNIRLDSFDILRWKLYGEPLDEPWKTHAISDFYPAHQDNGPNQPVCIGTDLNVENGTGVHCIVPVAEMIKDQKIPLPAEDALPPAGNPGETLMEGAIFDSWSMARECYKNDAGFNVAGSSDIKKGCTIKNFIDSHTKNYLTLTNVINPGIIGVDNPQLRSNKANIYYRLVAKGGTACRSSGTINVLPAVGQNIELSGVSRSSSTPLPREYAEISADGFAAGGTVKQSIDVRIKLNSFLPVFNFSLYRTDTTKDTVGE